MNLDEIDKKCFILALFIRDDGQRFLLGSGAYEFKDSQLHFSANTMSNDVVEVQGNDGYLLAGQVRRPTTQVFDGYIGDASINKPDIEGYRRDFFAFFQKNHFYTVVYIFPDGTAIQRRRGFIVDASEVRELYQMFPEYHIGLNFEDVNYYKYAEDEDGNEQYAKSIDINISKAVSGGLIWNEVSQTQAYNHGTDFSISGTIEDEPVDHIDLYGDTEQTTYSGKNLFDKNSAATGYIVSRETGVNEVNVYYVASDYIAVQAGEKYRFGSTLNRWYSAYYDSNKQYTGYPTNTAVITIPSGVAYIRISTKVTNVDTAQFEKGEVETSYEPYVGGTASPNPDYPQEVKTVTGEQTVTISDGNGQSQSYSVNLGDIELCKIGTYQDYIYSVNGDYYLHKEIGKFVANGSENWIGTWNNPNTPDYWTAYLTQANFTDNYVTTMDDQDSSRCDYFTVAAVGSVWNLNGYGYALHPDATYTLQFKMAKTFKDNVTDWKNWLSTHNMSLYYALATPTDTQITDATLIAQLEALNSATTYAGVTWFKTESEYLPADTWAYVQIQAGGGVVWDNYGATWEEGGGGMIVNVNVDSIENVYPVWTVNGPTDTPILTNLTTGTSITYNGNITASQTLVVDMLNQTALLNGTSVIGKLSGDWIELAPGMNRMSYTATNEQTAPKSTLEWQEIVG